MRLIRTLRVAGQQTQGALVLFLINIHLIDRPLLTFNQRGQFGEQNATHSGQIALALKHARKLCEVGLEPVLLLVAFRGDTQVINHRVDVVLQLSNFAARLHLNGTSEVAFRHSSRDLGDSPNLRGEIGGEQVDVAGEILPSARRTRYVSLATKSAIDTDLARDVRHLFREGRKRVGHVVDGVGERGDFAFRHDGQLLVQIAVRDSSHHFHDAAHLRRKVGAHRVHRVGQIFPRSRDAGHDGLHAQTPFGSNLARHARHFGSKRAQLLHHRVDCFLELKNFAAHVHGDFAREVAVGHRDGDFGNIANLAGKIGRHDIHGVRKVFPCARHARNHSLTAKTAFGADLARHARHFSSESVELIHHRIDGVFELKDFALHIDGDLAR